MSQSRTALSWLSDAVLYQIYPQSFADSDGDGIGDLAGIVERLDYLAWLGVDTVWLNPCFASEFGDGGYDVVDYLSIAPRYGTNEDAAKLIDAASSRGIRVMFDLVPGHTSHRHPWFQESANTPGDHRYIWSDRIASPMREWIPNQGARGGFYRANFFPIQPALNFGYARSDETEPWRQPVDADGPMANRAALRDVMAFWFDRGVSGFRVDMAFSLVKDDPGQVETGNLWRQMREWIDRSYPHCAYAPLSKQLIAFGKCLDAFGGATANGTRAIIQTCHGRGNQLGKWVPSQPAVGNRPVGTVTLGRSLHAPKR